MRDKNTHIMYIIDFGNSHYVYNFLEVARANGARAGARPGGREIDDEG